MGTGGINQTTQNELIMALRQRYLEATKIEKTKILDEFTALAKVHRKHAIRMLRKEPIPPVSSLSSSVNAGRRVYDEAVKESLVIVWEAADRICGKRLERIAIIGRRRPIQKIHSCQPGQPDGRIREYESYALYEFPRCSLGR